MRGRVAQALVAGWVLGAGCTAQGSLGVPNSLSARGWPHAEPGMLHSQPVSLRVGFARPGGGYDVRTIALETYVARVLAGEAVRDSRPAALEALAVTLRTFALANPGRHRADGFDLCDQTHCQVVRAATSATERAAEATAGQLLLRHGAPAPVYYSASCGGRTEMPSHVWPGAEDPSYMPSQADDACDGTPAWSAELAADDLLRALRAAGFRGRRLARLKIAARNSSGRVARLNVEGLTPGVISGQDLRMAVGRTLGWQHIKSTAFELGESGGIYRFTGHGSGHGVGLCVIGSAKLAEAGRDAAEILSRYFPGLSIGLLSVRVAATPSPPGAAAAPTGPPVAAAREDVVVALPDGDEGERGVLVKTALRARDDLARVLGVPVLVPLTLRVHPTTDAYERATGHASYTSGAIVNGELHLLPLSVLRERGVLDRTIRHELVHLLTDKALAGRPAWVREGAAIYFAGEPPIPGEVIQRPSFRPAPRLSCPTDAELQHPVSVGALSNAYARARGCFAKQITSGRTTWRDVK
jgi:SpoIID/LytB domain protein